ncbi:lytic polysaccharide monooxygenase [Streptomyces sp. IBSNAI002]|uniref:lytic polysaccharide monooxygenase n=1 Tax=Streptomyces sp. IBSNAI002 TaxID=3457500 RepID=UPI003FD39565
MDSGQPQRRLHTRHRPLHRIGRLRRGSGGESRRGYDPVKPLAWSDLEPQPFLTVTDPPLTGNTYTFTGQLPTGRTGRHLLLTVWRNTDLPDTYYSCSDVYFPGEGPAGAAAAGPVTSGSAPGAGADTSLTLTATVRTPDGRGGTAAVASAVLASTSVLSFLLLVFWVRRTKRC